MVHMESYVEVFKEYQLREYTPDEYVNTKESDRDLKRDR